MENYQEKQEIFRQYSKSKGFDNWRHLLQKAVCDGQMTVSELKDHIFAACDLVQAEQQNRIAEKAKIKIIYAEKDEFTDSPIELGPVVDKKSITNPENKIH